MSVIRVFHLTGFTVHVSPYNSKIKVEIIVSPFMSVHPVGPGHIALSNANFEDILIKENYVKIMNTLYC